MIASALKKLFSPAPAQTAAHNLYVQIVSQARQPVFYKDWQVEDSIDGRFDIIVLHLFLIVSRFGEENPDFIRVLSEVFFSDMDRSLREMGASDTGVGIRVKKMAQAFYGRLKAYGDTIDNTSQLMEALRHNVYREQPVSAETLQALAAYVQKNHRQLQAQSLENIFFSS